MTWAAADQLLSNGLQALAISESAAPPLQQFLRLLQKWNSAYNLTSVEEPEQMVTHHLFDALVVQSFLKGPNIVDVGTGAGIPGIPLAIICPDFRFTLLDSNSKKTRFIQQAIIELRLTNVVAEHNRAERFQPARRFDTVLSRAFTSLAQMLEMTQHLCAPDGVFVAMKGRYPGDELKDVHPPFGVERVASIQVPFLEAERHVVLLKHLSPPPDAEG